MTRGSKNLKRRSGARPVTRRKRHDKFKKVFTHELVAKKWDSKKTLRQNYEAMGIEANPNTHDKLVETTRLDPKSPDGDVEFVDVKALRQNGGIPVERNPRRPPHFVSEDDANYLDRLVKKHGDDYTAMMRDMKLNNMQWTKAKLQRQCEKLVLHRQWLDEQEKMLEDSDSE